MIIEQTRPEKTVILEPSHGKQPPSPSIFIDLSSSMANDSSKTTLPPRTLNVQKFIDSRASELESLQLIIANRLNDDFRSRRHTRRRTTGHDDRVARKRYRKRSKVVEIGKTDGSALEVNRGKHPRRVRRRFELQNNPEIGFCVSGDGTRRLRTHVWHAKRFNMSKLWGFHLPLGFPGRGKGSRALLKKLNNGVLIHDASYCSAVQLEGPESSLLSILRMILAPSTSAYLDYLASSVVSEATHGRAILHHFGALDSQPIAPVTFMWRPSCHQTHIELGNVDQNINDEPRQSSCCSPFRQIWVWLHASVFSEGYDVMKSACQKEMDETGIPIKCLSLEGHLGKFEVMGLNSFQVLQKILHPVACFLENSFLLEGSSVQDSGADFKKFSIQDNASSISSDRVLSLIVSDPRSSTEKTSEIVPAETSTIYPDRVVEKMDWCDNSASLLSYQAQNHSLPPGDKELWNVVNGIDPPLEENILCVEKHKKRRVMFCLNDKGSSQIQNSSTKAQFSRVCPILLFKNSQKSTLLGWSIVLPLSWSKAFWVPLVTNGAHAIGLTEKHWVACEVQLPSFPADFPDCNAYSCFMKKKAEAFDEKSKLRPLAKRPFRIPIPPPWGSICLNHGKGLTLEEKSEVKIDLLSNSGSKKCHSSFDGFIARKSAIFSAFMQEAQCDKRGFAEFLKNRGVMCSAMTPVMGRRSCFVRVVLHAFKEGVFEEGAVVCAPHLADIPLFTSRAGNDKGVFQIPMSCVQSYFKEESCGEWIVQKPEDPILQKSHRWPIGFVTTGFLRGSKKAAANAICEATLLACLREEQRNDMCTNRSKEIYVLVRNLRSTTYRLGLATIVLDEQEDDVEFL